MKLEMYPEYSLTQQFNRVISLDDENKMQNIRLSHLNFNVQDSF